MGKIVKGAQVITRTYQIKPPSIPAHSVAVPADDDDPVFAQLHQPQTGVQRNAGTPGIDLDALHAQAAGLIDDASANAQELVRQGQRRALDLIEEAQHQASAIEAAARETGFDQGLKNGRDAAQAEMDEMLETMRGLLEMARIERHKIIESAEPEIVRLSVAIAERILHGHIATDQHAVLDMVRSAITRLVNRETVTVRVNPADIATMREHREQLMSMNDIDHMRIIEDQRVDRGGVVIETDAGTIDAKVSTQLREARRLLAVDETLSVGPSNEPALINPPAQAS